MGLATVCIILSIAFIGQNIYHQFHCPACKMNERQYKCCI